MLRSIRSIVARAATVLRLMAVPLVLTGLVSVVVSRPVAAHGGPVQTSPGNLETVGGEVSQVTLVFNEPVTDVELVVIRPDGTTLPGEIDQPEPNVGRLTFAPLVGEGRYSVTFEVAFDDGAAFEGLFLFNYERSAPAPLPLSATLEVDERGTPGWLVVVGPVMTLAILALAGALLALSIEATRRSSGLAHRRSARLDEVDPAVRLARSRSR